MLIYILFVLGFAILIKGADLLVDGASSIAKKMKIPGIVIGLTILAFGTSLPELIVNIFASANGQADLAVGNILGSNISNILLILGISAIIYPLAVHKNTTYKEIPLALLAVLALGVVANDTLIDGMPESILTRSDGLVFILFFLIFLYYVYSISKTQTDKKVSSEIKIKMHKTWQAVSMILVGMVALFFGGQWIVDGAVHIAQIFGMSEALIGLTIVAIGTSLPELAASAMAAYKKQTDLAVGNVIGSNIFNIFWVLGLSSVIRPLNFSAVMNFDIIMVIVVTLILFTALFLGVRHRIGRSAGISMVVFYIIYIAFLIYRG